MYFSFELPCHMDSHTRMLLCTELLLAEDNPYVTMQSITTFYGSLGVLAGESVL